MFTRALPALAPLAFPLVLTCCATTEDREPGPDDYRIYRGDGSPASLNELYAASRAADVTFLGENHDDPVAHFLEEKILRETSEPGLALSLEMFETDVQLVLDEYLDGLITEAQFIKDARAWDNYDRAYAPLVDFAREQDMSVLAANAPRRYVNLVGREGAEALQELGEESLRFLPPLPFEQASPAYREKFVRVMSRSMPEDSHADMLEAQSLWDATMAWSLARHLQANPQARLLHVNGSFHTEGRLGTVEQLEHYRPQAEALVVTIQPSENFPAFDTADMSGLGDFVIVTPAPDS